MPLKRALPLFAIVLTLAGCFRQADEPFDTVNSQNVPQSIPATATQSITIIDPNATDVQPSAADTQAIEVEPSATVIIINPTVAQVEASATTEIIVIEPATSVPTVVPATSEPLTIPTATESGFVTPEIPIEVEVPTATPTQIVEQATLEPTPTAFGEDIVASECQYIVQTGDNLFRIAINNNVSLDALLSANGLSEASIIQPGQSLALPGCSGEGTTTEETINQEETAIPSPTPLSECQYVVQAGDTLYTIAIRNNLTLATLLLENSLAETSIIQPGQVLDLPNCADDESALAPIVEETEAVTGETGDSSDANTTIHTVASGETLLIIAQRYGVTVNAIIQANPNIPDLNNLTIGQQLVIPNQ
jgi:LysM repeat protein